MVLGLSMGTLLGFSALAVDIGMVRAAKTQLQVGVDAAVLGGVGYLDGTQAGVDLARSHTPVLAAHNDVLQQPISLGADDVQVGIYDPLSTPAFQVYVDGVHDPGEVNAVRVDHQPPNVRPGIAGIAFGRTGMTIDARAMAVRHKSAGPLKNSACFLPIAIPECALTGVPAGTNPAPMRVQFSPAPTDNVAWADIDNHPNTNELRNQLEGPCTNGVLEVGNTIHVSNGQNNAVLHKIADILNDNTSVAPEGWPTDVLGPVLARDGVHANTSGSSAVSSSNFGNIIQGPIPIVDAGCPNPSFTGEPEITGIAWAVLYDVDKKGGDKNIWVQLDFTTPFDIFGDVDPDATGPNTLGYGDPVLVVQ